MSSDYKVYKYAADFDFFDDQIPETDRRFFALGDQLKRARAILSKRSREEIEYLIESLDWMLRESSQVEHEKSILLLESEDAVFINRVKAFKLFSTEYDISDQKSLPNASWADYFAALSLVTILEALHPENSSNSDLNIDYSLESLEAVCIAEFHNQHDEESKKKLREKGKAGGMKRAKQFETLKKAVIDEYASNINYKNKSNRHAAKILVEKFSEEVKQVLSGEEPRNTVSRWIATYKKSVYTS